MIPQEPKSKESRPSLALHNIRSAHNVGAIFRTADAAGVTRIYLCGYTPAPLDRFGRERKDIKKAALGAEKTVEWQSVKDISSLISKLKKDGYTIIALEQDKKSLNYRDVQFPKKTLIILGNEVDGIDKKILSQCDVIVEIPMKGKKESLNVSVAAGILLFAQGS